MRFEDAKARAYDRIGAAIGSHGEDEIVVLDDRADDVARRYFNGYVRDEDMDPLLDGIEAATQNLRAMLLLAPTQEVALRSAHSLLAQMLLIGYMLGRPE